MMADALCGDKASFSAFDVKQNDPDAQPTFEVCAPFMQPAGNLSLQGR